MNIQIITRTLTDGCKVYDVRLTSDDNGVLLHATSASAADRLADKIYEAVNELTVDQVNLLTLAD